jgi:hypothetical protein
MPSSTAPQIPHLRFGLRIPAHAPLWIAALWGTISGALGCVVPAPKKQKTARGLPIERHTVLENPPPPPKKETPFLCPPQYYWKAGRWRWNGKRYSWIVGACKKRPPDKRGCRYIPGVWRRTRRGWHYFRSGWKCPLAPHRNPPPHRGGMPSHRAPPFPPAGKTTRSPP